MVEIAFHVYTKNARWVLFFAFREALILGDTEIRATHLLAGLLREGKTLFAARGFSRKKVKAVRETCQGNALRKRFRAQGQGLLFDHEVRAIFVRAVREMQNRRHKELDIEHLLLALLYVPSKAKDILNLQGLNYEQASATVPFQPGEEASAGDALDYT